MLTRKRLLFLGNVGLAVNFAFLASDAYIVHHLPRWGFLFVGLAIASFLHLALVTPEVRVPLHRGSRFVVDTQRLWHVVVHNGDAPRYALISSFESGPALDAWIARNS